MCLKMSVRSCACVCAPAYARVRAGAVPGIGQDDVAE